jgi:hypothetical protein
MSQGYISLLYLQRNGLMELTNQPDKQTPWSRVLLEKLITTQLVKKFATFYGT